MKEHSNIIIQDHEVDLDEWLKSHDVRIHLRQLDEGWGATLEGHLHVETPGPCASCGGTPLEAAERLVRWMTGSRISGTGPLGYVPRFNQESVVRAVVNAQHTDPKRLAQ